MHLCFAGIFALIPCDEDSLLGIASVRIEQQELVSNFVYLLLGGPRIPSQLLRASSYSLPSYPS